MLAATGILAALAPSPVARAQVTEAPKAALFPDPSKFSYGAYTGAELGAVVVLGRVRSHLRPGFGLGLAAGYDLTRWLAVEARAVGSTHLTQFPTAPQDGELLQLYQLLAAIRVSLRYRYFALSLNGDGGFLHTSTNVLATAGLNAERTGAVFGGGLGLEYHTLSRHFAFGVRGSLLAAHGLGQSRLLTTSALMRYTF